MGEKVARVRMCINERAGMEKYDSSNCERQHKVYKDAACEHCPQYREVEQVQEAGTIAVGDTDGDDDIYSDPAVQKLCTNLNAFIDAVSMRDAGVAVSMRDAGVEGGVVIEEIHWAGEPMEEVNGDTDGDGRITTEQFQPEVDKFQKAAADIDDGITPEEAEAISRVAHKLAEIASENGPRKDGGWTVVVP